MGNQSYDRPTRKPKLQYYHESVGSDCNQTDSFQGITAEDIHERIPNFVDTDVDKRPDFPPSNGFMPREATFEEYSKELAPYFQMKLEHGILEARAHTRGEELIWSLPVHAHVHKLFEYVANDRDVEVMIFGGTGDNLFSSIGAHGGNRDESRPFMPMPEDDPDYNWTLYEHSYIDGTSDIEYQVNLPIPLITVWNGGGFHTDLVLLSDITLATKDAWTTEQHFRVNMVPGDGVQIAWRELMGRKRFSYAELTGEIITAKKAKEYGMVNEIHEDTETCYKRAWELAELIMHTATRQTRRLTTQVLRRPWKKDVVDELRDSFAAEMWNTATEASPHHPIYWEAAKAQARAVLAAEEKGKVIYPRLGKFVEEDPIE